MHDDETQDTKSNHCIIGQLGHYIKNERKCFKGVLLILFLQDSGKTNVQKNYGCILYQTKKEGEENYST